MKESKVYDITATFFGWLWVLSWFGCIWLTEYSIRLFFTGTFSLFLGYNAFTKAKKLEGDNND